MPHKACHLPLAMSSTIIHAKGRNVKLCFTYKQHHSLIFVKSRLTSSLCRQSDRRRGDFPAVLPHHRPYRSVGTAHVMFYGGFHSSNFHPLRPR